MVVAWSTSDRVGTATLSNGNLTVRKTTTNAARGRADTGYSSGKYYLEYLQTISATGSVVGFGLYLASFTPLSGGYMGSGNASVGCWDDGVYYTGTKRNNVNVAGSGCVGAMAWDADNKLVWFRKYSSGAWGYWNDDPLADPATGVGGIDISAGGAGPWRAAFVFDTPIQPIESTADFGATAFVGSPPAGFTAYDGSTGGPVTYTLMAAAGTFVAVGQNARLAATRTMLMASAAFARSGLSAALLAARRLAGAVGSISISGQSGSLRATRKISAASAPFSGVGQAALLRAARRFPAATGLFIHSGQAAALVRTFAGQTLQASPGAFNSTVSAAGLRATRRLVASPVSFLSAGQPAQLLRTYANKVLAADVAALSITGQPAALRGARRVQASAGGFAFTALPAAIRKGFRAPASPGAIAFTGSAAGLRRSAKLRSGTGVISLTGQLALLIFNAAEVLQTPPSRTLAVTGERRTMTVQAERRVLSIAA